VKKNKIRLSVVNPCYVRWPMMANALPTDTDDTDTDTEQSWTWQHGHGIHGTLCHPITINNKSGSR
jgi:hypothetical protein